jgi:hypothetical protein
MNVVIANNQESRPFEQNNLIAAGDLTEVLEGLLDEGRIGYEELHDLGPCLIQRLIPNTRAEELLNLHILLLRLIGYKFLLGIVLSLLLTLLNLIHFVDQHKHRRSRTVSLEDRQRLLEVSQMVVDLDVIINVEHVDEHFDVLEDCFLEGGEILAHEVLLTAAVPEVEGQVTHELEFLLRTVGSVADL